MITAAALVTCGCALSTARSEPSDPTIDEASLHVVRARLDQARPGLDELADPPGTTGVSPARFLGCRRDSGDLFQPELQKDWTLDKSAVSPDDDVPGPAARQAHDALVQDLVAAGWVDDGNSYPEAVQRSMHKDFDGFRVTLGTGTYLDVLFLSAFTGPETVCTDLRQP